jgi:beta-mannosidase
MSFGWDFAPPIRTMGIWDEVRLVITGPVFVAEASAVGHPVLAHDRGDSSASPNDITTTRPVDLTLHLTLDADQPGQAETTVQLSPANFDGPTPPRFHFHLNLPAGRTTHQLPCHLPDVALWQPWDRGQPNLYHVHLTLTDPAGEPLDDLTLRTGFRAVELKQWHLRINGRPEFSRGLNWVPADSFPGRLREGDYARLLEMARESGANLLRVWGGGLREKQAFYDLCDELGLLVWQEFPFACMFLGSYPRDPAYLALVESECSGIVRQLRHHPSVILWCGGNEFSRRRNRPLLDTLAGVVEREDGSRPFIPVSPSFEHGRDAHNWRVWHGQAPIQSYQQETARFLSEFGLQALPHLDTLRTALPDPTINWPTHHADLPKLERYISTFNQKLGISSDQVSVNNLQLIIHNSQLAQAAALQTAIEHMRRRKGQAGGLCLWQFNEPWPAISWAIVDYFGRPKLAYDRLANWYNPVLISLDFPPGRRWQPGDLFETDIWAINDSLLAYPGCQLQIDLDGELTYTQSLDLPADSAHLIGALTHRLTSPPRQLSLTVHHHSELLAQNSYDLAWSDESSPGLLPRLRRWLADRTLR